MLIRRRNPARDLAKTAAEPRNDPWSERKEVFAISYQETLSALKHQDDKLNRSLTGLAFLTAAGVTLFTNLGSDSTLSFEEDGLPLPTFFFLAFVSFATIALLLILAAIGPSTPLTRKTKRAKGSTTPQFKTSLLYFNRILRDDDWNKHLSKSPAELDELIASNYHREAKDLSQRIDYKISRSREAAAFLHMSVVCLSLLGVFSAKIIDLDTKWLYGSVFLLILFLLPFWDLVQIKRLSFPEAKPDFYSYVLLALVVLAVTTLLFSARSRQAEWPALWYALLALLATRLAYADRSLNRWILSASMLAGILVFILFP